MTKRELADDEIPGIDETFETDHMSEEEFQKFATDVDYDPDGRYTAADLAEDIRQIIERETIASKPDAGARLRLIEAIHKHLSDSGL